MRKSFGIQMLLALLFAAIGVALWGFVSYQFNIRLGLIGIVIGFLVGKALSQPTGRWQVYHGLISVAITFLAILAGEFLSLNLMISKEFNMGLADTFALISYKESFNLILQSFGGKSIIIVIISLFEAFKLTKSSVVEEQVTEEAYEDIM